MLLLGVDHDVNTSLHLAQERSGVFGTRRQGAPVVIDGERTWVEYDELNADTDGFVSIGRAFEIAHGVVRGRIGEADATLLPQAPLVDFARALMVQDGRKFSAATE